MANVSSSNGLEKRPKLRFPGFDESYRTTPLGEIASLVNRTDPKSNAPIMMLSAGNGFIMQSEKYSRDNAGQSLKKYILLKQGELAYNHGASKAKQFGCCYELTEPEARIPYVYHCFKINDHEYTPFIAMALNNAKMDKQLKRLVSSSVRMDGLLNISFEDYMSVTLHLPSSTEQKHIADFLKKIDERIAAQEKLLASLKKYKRGVNNQILSQIDNSYNCRLGSVCEIVGGGTPDTLHTEYWGNTVEWFTPSEIGKTKYVNNSVRKLSDIGLDNSSAKLLPIGTVLLTTRATLGEMSIAKRECSTNQGFQSLIPHTDRVSSEYLYYMQIIIKPWCEKYASGNTFREISKSALSDCIIPIPDRARQEQIVKLLSSIDMLIGAAESISMSLSKIRHGLMQQLFI